MVGHKSLDVLEMEAFGVDIHDVDGPAAILRACEKISLTPGVY
jgi:hypothetical protein